MARERPADLLAALGVPQLRRSVRRRGDDALAVGAERRASHSSRMARERLADRLAALGVPQPRRVVPRRGDDALAVAPAQASAGGREETKNPAPAGARTGEKLMLVAAASRPFQTLHLNHISAWIVVEFNKSPNRGVVPR